MALRHPNREKVESQATRAILVILLLISAGLAALVTFAGWKLLEGGQAIAVTSIGLYLILALYMARWSRGALAFSAALAVLFGIVAATAAPAWFARSKTGFLDPALPSSLLGTLTVMLVITQGLVLLFAMRGFRQNWQVEYEEADTTDGQTLPGTSAGRGQPGGPRKPQAGGPGSQRGTGGPGTQRGTGGPRTQRGTGTGRPQAKPSGQQAGQPMDRRGAPPRRAQGGTQRPKA